MPNTYGGDGGGSGDPSNWLCFLPFRPQCGRREEEKTKTDDVQIFPTFSQLPESVILAKDSYNPEKVQMMKKNKKRAVYFYSSIAPLHHHPLVFSKFPFIDRCYDYGFEKSRQMLPLLNEATGTSVLVNSKQYHGILRRRRAKAKQLIRNPSNKKSITDQKPYKHESRHLHAMRRARGQGGRFLNTKKDKSPNTVAISFLETDARINPNTNDLNKIPKPSPSLFTGFMCNTSNIHSGINPPSSAGMSDKDEGSDVGGGFTTKWVTNAGGGGRCYDLLKV